jgi:hypothetical protein
MLSCDNTVVTLLSYWKSIMTIVKAYICPNSEVK